MEKNSNAEGRHAINYLRAIVPAGCDELGEEYVLVVPVDSALPVVWQLGIPETNEEGELP